MFKADPFHILPAERAAFHMYLISKKDLLALTGISYGQLYRWKRQRLIPEEWFIKRPSYTGQETFFPREQILSRINSILEGKDKYSLEQLAQLFSPDAVNNTISFEMLSSISEINLRLLPIIKAEYGKTEYKIFDLALLEAISRTSEKPGVSEENAHSLVRKAASLQSKPYGQTYTAFSAGGSMYIVLTRDCEQLQFDRSIKVIDTHSLRELAGKLNIKYRSFFKNF